MNSITSNKTAQFTESVIREMTRLCLLYHEKDGINLAQGFPDFDAPIEMKEAACKAIQSNINQYAITWGSPYLRQAIAQHTKKNYNITIDPQTQITVCCGATEAMFSSLMAIINPGDEVIVFSPYYENYWPDTVLSGAIPRFISLHEPDWSIYEKELKNAFSNKTRGIIINTPNNPTGKVFTKEELEMVATLCQKWNTIAFTDEIYEHLVYEGTHIPMMTLPGMEDRTVTISGASKTYSVTGWRIGWAIAEKELTSSIRKVHDFITVGAPAPLQEAVATALNFPDSYYKEFLEGYRQRRGFLYDALQQLDFKVFMPHGAYYMMTEYPHKGFKNNRSFNNDVEFAHFLVKELGVAVVPGSSFYRNMEDGRRKVRFAFPKKMETLKKAVILLKKLNIKSF